MNIENMHDYLNERQKKAVVALKIVREVCEKYNIQYYLLAGSVLGAARHQGFIPWDDDIDIGVGYKDWYKLRKILREKLPSEFIYIDNIMDPNFPRFPGKIIYQGESLMDIFMLVNWTSNILVGNLCWELKRVFVMCYRFSINSQEHYVKTNSISKNIKYHIKHFLKKNVYFILHLFLGRDDFMKRIRQNENRFIKYKADIYINLYSIYKMEKEKIKKEWLMSPSYVKFEDEFYPTVSDVDAYLTHLFGDYMSLPPAEKQVVKKDELVINYMKSKYEKS